MKKSFFAVFFILVFLAVNSAIFGTGEKTLSIGSVSGWNDMIIRQGLTEIPDQRPSPVLTLSSASPAVYNPPDLYLSFDEGNPNRFKDCAGNYNILVSGDIGAADYSLARHGAGAAKFTPGRPFANSASEIKPLVMIPGRGALFAPGNHIRDFTIEFWLCPSNPENGEQVLEWNSTLRTGASDLMFQRIQCLISRNRLQWTFSNFFVDPNKKPRFKQSPLPERHYCPKPGAII